MRMNSTSKRSNEMNREIQVVQFLSVGSTMK